MLLLSRTSQKRLMGTHPFFTILVTETMKRMNKRKTQGLDYTDFSVFEGLRSEEKQIQNIKKGVSWNFDTYHFYGLAIDLVVYIPKVGLTWNDKKYYKEWNTLLIVTNEVIKDFKLPIQNGFTLWKKDKPHFQMTNFKPLYDFRKYFKQL